jgi:hypothetical protein
MAMAGKGRAQGGKSGGYRENAGRPRNPIVPDGVKRPRDAVGYLQAVMNDEGVTAGRRDQAARALLSMIGRQGGLGKKAQAELAAKEVTQERGEWWDEELGISLLDPGWGNRAVSAAKRKADAGKTEDEKAWEEILEPSERRPGKSDWGDDLRYDPEPRRPTGKLVRYQEPPDDE